MIYITHDQEEACAMSDRIMVMGKGIIHQIDTPENLIRYPEDEYVEQFVGHNLRLKVESILKHLNT
jgi:ABC-type Fe3+/spermidine/putrescine transport system ATPase subunit